MKVIVLAVLIYSLTGTISACSKQKPQVFVDPNLEAKKGTTLSPDVLDDFHDKFSTWLGGTRCDETTYFAIGGGVIQAHGPVLYEVDPPRRERTTGTYWGKVSFRKYRAFGLSPKGEKASNGVTVSEGRFAGQVAFGTDAQWTMEEKGIAIKAMPDISPSGSPISWKGYGQFDGINIIGSEKFQSFTYECKDFEAIVAALGFKD